MGHQKTLAVRLHELGFDGVPSPYEIRDWINNRHSIFISAECFNYTSWGWRMYDTGVQFDQSAPIIDEAPPYMGSVAEALVDGIKAALLIIESR